MHHLSHQTQRHDDTTNAFKAHRKTVIVELLRKAIVRGYSWAVIPITWRNRRHGEAKLKIKEMGRRYLFICRYLWLEKCFSRGGLQEA